MGVIIRHLDGLVWLPCAVSACVRAEFQLPRPRRRSWCFTQSSRAMELGWSFQRSSYFITRHRPWLGKHDPCHTLVRPYRSTQSGRAELYLCLCNSKVPRYLSIRTQRTGDSIGLSGAKKALQPVCRAY
ncbi:hypothetical protein F4819DRAFT_315046 [Hypoxylon fuscum]|nr:hypothetical protein F4819DRAFT_315046 [Hypoxylon fuscum]